MAKRSSVFINCPFDEKYKPLFDAISFVVQACDFDVVCALASDDSGRVRIEKICRMIQSSPLGIHDISRTELDDATKLPRFNMPLELGLFLGAAKFGKGKQKKKITLILDKEPHRYQQFMSDIAGQDIHSHSNKPGEAIHIVRNWLGSNTAELREHPLPSGKKIAENYDRFCAELPMLCAAAGLDVKRLSYPDFLWLVKEWLKRNVLVKK
ncbi:MAG: hypothetical protein HY961_05115 [Ignavibacteriae bacterium]|nr:hypothetical protein [Ignavibacteriota bacterium]